MFKLLSEYRKEGKCIGFTSGVFDVLHAGHVVMLQEAAAQCDILVVGLLTDPTDRPDKRVPVQSVLERFIQVQAVKGVEMVIPFGSEVDLKDLLLTLLPDVRFVGEEYQAFDHTGKNIEGIKIIYNKRRHRFSSTDLVNRITK